MITKKLKKIFIIFVLSFLYVYLFINAPLVNKAVVSAIGFCVNRLVPSVFIFMILSAVVSGSREINEAIFPKRAEKNFSLTSTVLFSWLSGFVIGPAIISKNAENKDITKYVILTSNCGIGFVVSYVGATLWNSIAFGIFLYIIQILSSIFLFVCSKKSKDFYLNEDSKLPLMTSVTNSIQLCTNTVINMCGFTVFFSVIMEIVLKMFDVNSVLFAGIVSSFLEICEGTLSASKCSNLLLCGFLTGFSVGFGGICMCMQTFSVCKKSILNKKIFVFKKLLQGLICGGFSALFVTHFCLNSDNNQQVGIIEGTSLGNVLLTSIFCSLAFLNIKEKIYKNYVDFSRK